MTRFAPDDVLIRVSKARKRDVDLWCEVALLRSRSGRSIEALLRRVVLDRLEFARRLYRDGKRLTRGDTPEFRTATGRFYYSLYQAARAIVFSVSGGDDYEEHKKLPGHLPSDFPDRDLWANDLKNARDHRNAADYDPYPKSDSAWRGVALRLEEKSRTFLGVSRRYLESRGTLDR